MNQFQFLNRPNVVHLARVAMFGAFLVLIHLYYKNWTATQDGRSVGDVDIEIVRAYFSSVDTVDEGKILDANGKTLGRVVQTSPSSDHIVGFSGPTNAALFFDPDDRLTAIEILSSRDTPAHVRQVENSPIFFSSFVGRSKTSLSSASHVDGVSGATLTSVAIRESIVHRLGGTAKSLRFPNPPQLELVQELFPEAVVLEPDDDFYWMWQVRTELGTIPGRILRTTPSADSVRGYQGPTDCLIGFDLTWNVVGIRPGKSYDNEEYVYYARVDDYFLNLFNGKELSELARLDLNEAEVEGVSGATYTSMAIARGLVLAARDADHGRLEFYAHRSKFQGPLPWHDVGTGVVVLFGIVVGSTRLRGNRIVRIAFPLVLITFLGLINGDMLSQAALAGWARHGIPWGIAPGLIFMSAVALLIPITTRHNLYCHHLCPHGAAQQLLRRVTKHRIRIPKRILRRLLLVPGLIAAVCLIFALKFPTVSLVDLEPFDAYVFRVAGWATLTIAIVGLILSLVIPMAYCRFGCPTGFVLNFLRKSSDSQWSRTDWAVFASLLVSAAFWGFAR
jgi:hypothetical protein